MTESDPPIERTKMSPMIVLPPVTVAAPSAYRPPSPIWAEARLPLPP